MSTRACAKPRRKAATGASRAARPELTPPKARSADRAPSSRNPIDDRISDPRLFAADDAIRRIGEGLLARTLPRAEWTHEAHLAATTYLLTRRPDIELERDLPDLIRRYNESVGGVNNDTQGYHETITRAVPARRAAVPGARPTGRAAARAGQRAAAVADGPPRLAAAILQRRAAVLGRGAAGFRAPGSGGHCRKSGLSVVSKDKSRSGREQAMIDKAVEILGQNRLMSLATIGEDGWPHCSMVGFANEELSIYFVVSRTSQKMADIGHDDRVAIVIGRDVIDPASIRGLSIRARAVEVENEAERKRAISLLLKRRPALKHLRAAASIAFGGDGRPAGTDFGDRLFQGLWARRQDRGAAGWPCRVGGRQSRLGLWRDLQAGRLRFRLTQRTGARRRSTPSIRQRRAALSFAARRCSPRTALPEYRKSINCLPKSDK